MLVEQHTRPHIIRLLLMHSKDSFACRFNSPSADDAYIVLVPSAAVRMAGFLALRPRWVSHANLQAHIQVRRNRSRTRNPERHQLIFVGFGDVSARQRDTLAVLWQQRLKLPTPETTVALS
jgi:hypothetical protein